MQNLQIDKRTLTGNSIRASAYGSAFPGFPDATQRLHFDICDKKVTYLRVWDDLAGNFSMCYSMRPEVKRDLMSQVQKWLTEYYDSLRYDRRRAG